MELRSPRKIVWVDNNFKFASALRKTSFLDFSRSKLRRFEAKSYGEFASRNSG